MVDFEDRIIYEKSPSIKEDLLTPIWESWYLFDEEYCFKLIQSMSKSMWKCN